MTMRNGASPPGACLPCGAETGVIFVSELQAPGAGEMAQRVKGLAAKPEDLSLIPGTVEGKNRLLKAVLCPAPQVCHVPPHARTHKHDKGM